MARTFRTCPLRAALIFWAGLVCAAFAQTDSDPADVTLRSNVNEVRVAFSTTDENNRVVATVQPTDFAIVDQDRVVREFRSFGRSEYTRMDVVVLVDASGSVTPQFRKEFSHVVQLIAETQNLPDESFAVVSFRDLKPSVVCDGNCRELHIEAKFPVVSSGGPTPLYDSIVFASQMLEGRGDLHTRRILVLFSDGADTISMKSFTDAMNSALDNDVAIYSVDVSNPGYVSSGALVLRSFAANTGGRYFPIKDGTRTVLDAILEDFRATYIVTYKLPSHVAGFHQLGILPTHDLGLHFHCRRGYYYPGNPEN